jgi:CubicO group peptidase (beta-lactamase class C family)
MLESRYWGIARRLHVGIAALAVFASAARAGTEEDRFEPVRQRIAKALVDHNIPSFAVAVAHEGKIVWEQGFGWADRENRVPADEHTMYSIASVSKPITATGLMVLVGRKRIELDKPINDYLGEAKLRARLGDAAGATVRRVANHTSGLPLHYQFFYADEAHRPPTRDETIRRFGNLVTEPGEHYQYSNLGYGVLDYIVERASGKRFADFMREEVFLPLGMTHTSIDVGPGLEPHQAIRYTNDGRRIPLYEFDHHGASAVYASAHYLARFAMFHMN